MDYFEAKKKGFKFVTRDLVGGECVHFTMPKRKNKYWFSDGWRYIDGGGCLDKTKVMTIDEAIHVYQKLLAIKAREEQAAKMEVAKAEAVKDEPIIGPIINPRFMPKTKPIRKPRLNKSKVKRVCKICGFTFETEHGSTQYCSKWCKAIANKRKMQRYHERQKKKGYPSIYQRCGKAYISPSKGRKYCSDECRKAK